MTFAKDKSRFDIHIKVDVASPYKGMIEMTPPSIVQLWVEKLTLISSEVHNERERGQREKWVKSAFALCKSIFL